LNKQAGPPGICEPHQAQPIFGVDALHSDFGFMELQDVQELTNFFERRVSAYQVAVTGEVAFHDDF
jgi:ribonucleoside-diphosphate reductase beta chain